MINQISRSFNFLNFTVRDPNLKINLHLINNSYNYNYFKFKKKAEILENKQNLYRYYLLNLCEFSQNVYIVDGFANRIRPDSNPLLLEKIRFNIGDLDSVYGESLENLNKLNIPALFYEDQNKTDLEKSLEISLMFQSNDFNPEILKDLDIQIIDPHFKISENNQRLKTILNNSNEKKFLDKEDWDKTILNIYENIKQTPPTQTIIFDYMGNRSDHVM